MNRDEKVGEIEFLREQFATSKAAFCADFRGLTVGQITQLRKDLRGAGAVGRVIKNTLAKLSVKNALKDEPTSEIEKFLSLFTGPNLIVFAKTDPVGPAKIIAKCQKDLEKFQIKGAWFDSAYLAKAEVDTLATMPGREELFSMLLRLINTPATQLVRVLHAPGTQVARVLEARREQLEKQAA